MKKKKKKLFCTCISLSQFFKGYTSIIIWDTHFINFFLKNGVVRDVGELSIIKIKIKVILLLFFLNKNCNTAYPCLGVSYT